MKNLLYLLFITTCATAQVHTSSPLPVIDSENKKVIDEDITGWSKSLDGQWISKEMVIPIRAVSQDEEAYEGEEMELGLDNISELHLYPTYYGKDTLITLVKLSKSGKYKYEATKQGWEDALIGYYYVFSIRDLKKLRTESAEIQNIRIPLRDYGALGEVKSKRVPDELKRTLILKPKTDRFLVADLQFDSLNSDKIYFQLSSQHKIFPEVEGIIKDLTINGRSMYSSPYILEYLHYEIDKNTFYEFFDSNITSRLTK